MELMERPISSREIFRGRIVRLRLDEVSLPDGRTARREVVDHPGGVCILALDEQGRAAVVRQFRYAFGRIMTELPAGKLEPGESPEAALRRELREELSIDVRVGRIVDAVYHRYPDRDVLLLFYRCEITEGAPIPVDCNAVEWPRIEDVPRYDFADADRVFVERNLI